MRLFHERLENLTADEVLRIHQQFSLNLARSYTWELWGAAYVINGGCSDDCFEYFRAALIMRGRSTFETALVNPDSLAKQPFINRPTELEEALSVSRDVYHSKTGKEPTGDVAYAKLSTGWDFDDASEHDVAPVAVLPLRAWLECLRRFANRLHHSGDADVAVGRRRIRTRHHGRPAPAPWQQPEEQQRERDPVHRREE